MVTETQLFESPDLSPLDSRLWGWMKVEVYKRKKDTRDKLLARILDISARVNQREDTPTSNVRSSHTRLTVGFANIYCKLFSFLFRARVYDYKMSQLLALFYVF